MNRVTDSKPALEMRQQVPTCHQVFPFTPFITLKERQIPVFCSSPLSAACTFMELYNAASHAAVMKKSGHFIN